MNEAGIAMPGALFATLRYVRKNIAKAHEQHSRPARRQALLTLPEGFLPRDCAFTASDWNILSRQCFPVARAIDVHDKPISVTLLDLELVVYRTTSGIHVGRDLCPHRGVPLSMGCVRGEELVCAYHGLRYDTEGKCVQIPAQPSLKPPARMQVTMFPSVERYGLVWTCLSPEGDASIPSMPSWGEYGYQPILPPFVDVGGSAGRQIEGFVDVAHFAFIHAEAFADPDNPVIPAYDRALTGFGLRSSYLSSVSNYPKALQHLAQPDFECCGSTRSSRPSRPADGAFPWRWAPAHHECGQPGVCAQDPPLRADHAQS